MTDRHTRRVHHLAGLPTKTFAGVKRKRTAEISAANNKTSLEKWSCALCHMNTSSELSFEEHCAGHRNQSNVADMELMKESAGLKSIATTESCPGMKHNPTACSCCICHVKCSGELDLKNHLKGRRHQENVDALWGESKEVEGKSKFPEAKLHEKKEPQAVEMNQRPASRWNCSICNANCTSDSDLESHLQGRRH
uniref:C2H2-type domain-containing protein n=1 Tax=Arundo donax TaxID=35708 RepID=A0A0A9A3W6_ARUDO